MKIRKLLCILLVAAFACTAFASCTALVVPNDAPQNSAAAGALTYISLRINPEIEMVADETGTVVSANAVNTDGEVVLSAVELEGKTVEDAAVAFTETAVDLGYMDGKDTVNVDVQSENAEVTAKVEKSLADKVMKFFEKKGIAGKVSKEVLDTYLAKAEEWNVAPGHAKIIARVLEANPELTYDELLNLTVKELLKLLKTEKHADKIAVDCKDDYKAAVKALKEEYKELFELREAIDDIEDDLEDAREEDDDDDDDDDKLTAEEIAALEKELAEKKAALEELEKEYEEKLAALKAEFKVSSKEARDEHRKEAEDRKQAKKDGKKYEKPERDDDDDDDDDDDRDDKKHDGKDDKDDEKDEKPAKPEHDDDDDDDDDDDKKEGYKGDKKPENKPAESDAPAATTAA